jgi:regulator of extracellular matrix RemA (YlzA/DUF370 family)
MIKEVNGIKLTKVNGYWTPINNMSTLQISGVGELRSLPNGVKDEINVTNRKLIKRIGEKSNIANGMVIDFADMAEGGTYYAWNDDGETETGVKGDTLGIDNVTLIYQLAEPVEIPIEVSGTLLSYPSGIVYVEPITKEQVVYEDGLRLGLPALPNGIEKVVKYGVEGATGIENGISRTTTSTNVKIVGHGLSSGKYIINKTRSNALRSVTVVDEDNLIVSAVSGQTVGDIIVKAEKMTDIVAEGGGTSDTSIRKTAHGLTAGDFIRNTNRGYTVSQVTRVIDADNILVEKVTGQTEGDTIEVYKALGTQVAEVDNILYIDGAEDGEVYEVIYEYPSEMITSPILELSYPMNTMAWLDGIDATLNRTVKKVDEFKSHQNAVNLMFDLRIATLEIQGE